jgi:hypothetical protein
VCSASERLVTAKNGFLHSGVCCAVQARSAHADQVMGGDRGNAASLTSIDRMHSEVRQHWCLFRLASPITQEKWPELMPSTVISKSQHSVLSVQSLKHTIIDRNSVTHVKCQCTLLDRTSSASVLRTLRPQKGIVREKGRVLIDREKGLMITHTNV